MSVFGISEPVIIGIIVAIIVFIKYGLPIIKQKKSLIDYSNFNVKDSVAFWTFAGNSGPAYTNLQLSKPPVVHGNGRATIYLEGIPEPLRDVRINENDKECDAVLKRTADALFGTRIDVLCRIDGNSCRQEWDNVYVQNWSKYVDRFKEAAKQEYLTTKLEEKEFVDELKDAVPLSASNVGVSLNDR